MIKFYFFPCLNYPLIGLYPGMSILWGWTIDKTTPDRYDIMGGMVCLVGVFIIMY
ncbi:MAG: YnfA family protein [Planctomycetota bacterium]